MCQFYVEVGDLDEAKNRLFEPLEFNQYYTLIFVTVFLYHSSSFSATWLAQIVLLITIQKHYKGE
jgi:hypothetical protein